MSCQKWCWRWLRAVIHSVLHVISAFIAVHWRRTSMATISDLVLTGTWPCRLARHCCTRIPCAVSFFCWALSWKTWGKCVMTPDSVLCAFTFSTVFMKNAKTPVLSFFLHLSLPNTTSSKVHITLMKLSEQPLPILFKDNSIGKRETLMSPLCRKILPYYVETFGIRLFCDLWGVCCVFVCVLAGAVPTTERIWWPAQPSECFHNWKN